MSIAIRSPAGYLRPPRWTGRDESRPAHRRFFSKEPKAIRHGRRPAPDCGFRLPLSLLRRTRRSRSDHPRLFRKNRKAIGPLDQKQKDDKIEVAQTIVEVRNFNTLRKSWRSLCLSKTQPAGPGVDRNRRPSGVARHPAPRRPHSSSHRGGVDEIVAESGTKGCHRGTATSASQYQNGSRAKLACRVHRPSERPTYRH